ncbi:MAG TPA: hypothetical protein VJ916_09440 [Anaerovoracaceae bacterium]|nr:hypothetical protein [Anaerovoracaceae bacterium]
MIDRSKKIFGNKMSEKTVLKAEKSKEKFIEKFGDDKDISYYYHLEDNRTLKEPLGVKNMVLGEQEDIYDDKSIIIGNIRMGFGHYRISMAMASAANSLGYTPYWMDLNSMKVSTGGKVINNQNELYSFGSRLSSKSKTFNKYYWEPLNYEGFRKISYNAVDQKNAELMAPLFKEVPKDIPVVATHVWPAQAAVHGGMKHVVNVIPDNWPMALHLAEGSYHTVQTYSSYLGYRALRGMDGNNILKSIPKEYIEETGHYIDHELVSNIKIDCEKRIERNKSNKPMRFLLTIGGAGAQGEIFAAIIKYLMPFVKRKEAVVFVNVGDYKNVWINLVKDIEGLKNITMEHFDDWDKSVKYANHWLNKDIYGIHSFYHEDIFEAVYMTNLLIRCSDVLITKPSELAFYPIPKLFIKRVGGHEKWGAIHSSELGDGTIECEDIPNIIQMLKMMMEDRDVINKMCYNIVRNYEFGIYDGAYNVIKKAIKIKEEI